MNIIAPKKLIELALPLKDINEAAAREKSIRHGHPSTLHLWWARRPLAAARAVIFAQMVNAPGWEHEAYGTTPTPQQKSADTRKKNRLFNLIRELVKWENTNHEDILEQARAEIRESWRETCEANKGLPGFDPEKLPAFHDPFAGGGAIPLEAQRLGLESYASDLNPVPVMINKAMIEIPPKFANRPPIGPEIFNTEAQRHGERLPGLNRKWKGAEGLAEDVRRYGYWMREEAKKRIGHLYPPVEITAEMAKDRPDLKPYIGRKLTVIAWLWARTVKSPNPQFSDVDVPLVSSFVLSKKKGKEAWVEPVVDEAVRAAREPYPGRAGAPRTPWHFEVRTGAYPKEAENGTKLGRGAKFYCLMSKAPMDDVYVRSEGMAHRMGSRLMAIVAEGDKGRVYLSPIHQHEEAAAAAKPTWRPETLMAENPRWFSPPAYGMKSYGDIFTNRQLVALNTFSDLVQEARVKAIADAKAAGLADDGKRLADGGTGATAYGDALAVYLTFGVSRISHYWSNISSWHSGGEKMQCIFSRQAIPMAWDYAECDVFSSASGNWIGGVDWIVEAVANLVTIQMGHAEQADAQTQQISATKVISTDPPYYDNIGYADLSDFFYVWLRRTLKEVFPCYFSTLSTPKAEELVATPYRHGGRENAETFFLDGMTGVMSNLAKIASTDFPLTIYYAFKSSETREDVTSNTGWETFLSAILSSGLQITGTWPMRTEMMGRAIARTGSDSTNALASSIVLVCRKRPEDAPEISRAEFTKELKKVMRESLLAMTGTESLEDTITDIAPVDLAQAAIGPGMGVFSKYKAVLKSDGSKMSVHEAMIDINKEIERVLDPDNASYDASTNFFIAWFKSYGFGEGKFGEADVLARAKGTTVGYIVASDVAESKAGEFRILHWKEYPQETDYDPAQDANLPLWEALHRVIRELLTASSMSAAKLLSRMPSRISADDLRQLAYYMYTYCERKGDAANAKDYNALVTSWSDIADHLMQLRDAAPKTVQGELF